MKQIEIEISKRMLCVANDFYACKKTFIALGNENRQAIIMALLENYGGLRVGQLSKIINLSRPAISHHIKILKDSGIISMFKVGTKNFYHLETNENQWDSVSKLLNQINDLVQDVSKNGLECKSEDI